MSSAGRIENLNRPLMAPRPQFFAHSKPNQFFFPSCFQAYCYRNIELACWTGDHVSHVVIPSEPFKQVYTSKRWSQIKIMWFVKRFSFESLNKRRAFNPCSLSPGSLKQAAVTFSRYYFRCGVQHTGSTHTDPRTCVSTLTDEDRAWKVMSGTKSRQNGVIQANLSAC